MNNKEMKILLIKEEKIFTMKNKEKPTILMFSKLQMSQ